MILLAIDTATESCSAALWVDGKVFQKITVQPRLHAELILSFIDDILKQASLLKSDIQGIIVSQGPGAFTGVRIGVGVAQGISLALDIPVLAVSNLKSLAYTAYKKLNTDKKINILVATDARMNEVYSAKYTIQGNIVNQLSDEKVSPASEVDLNNIDAYIGSGFSVYPELIEFAQNLIMKYDTNVYSEAKNMLLMVKDDFNDHSQNIDIIEPVYLREP
jgi:tRNA threonylcarbamoyladenosine biosynthesis protein TsaB